MEDRKKRKVLDNDTTIGIIELDNASTVINSILNKKITYHSDKFFILYELYFKTWMDRTAYINDLFIAMKSLKYLLAILRKIVVLLINNKLNLRIYENKFLLNEI